MKFKFLFLFTPKGILDSIKIFFQEYINEVYFRYNIIINFGKNVDI